MKRRMGRRCEEPQAAQLPQDLTPQGLRRGDWPNLRVGLLRSLPPALASAFLPPAFCLGDSGLYFQSTLIVPIFQATSVLPMGGSPLPSLPQVPLLFLYPELEVYF